MTARWMPIQHTSLAVRIGDLNEQQAQTNHGQTLQRLAERGGLSLCEALALIEKRRWRRMEFGDALNQLIDRLSGPLDEVAALRAEVEECDQLRERMADILTRTANALRGDPGPDTAWSWHDLPELAAAAVAAGRTRLHSVTQDDKPKPP